jgi:hypothetical protein
MCAGVDVRVENFQLFLHCCIRVGVDHEIGSIRSAPVYERQVNSGL